MNQLPIENLFGETLDSLSLSQLKELVYSLASHNPQIVAELLLQYAPLNLEQLKLMLHEGIDHEIDRGEILENSECTIERLCNALASRAYKITIQEWDLAGAFAIHAMIIVAIAEQMEKVYDEGWTFQCIIIDAFERLQGLAAQIEDQATRDEFINICLDAISADNNATWLYKNTWTELMGKITGMPVTLP